MPRPATSTNIFFIYLALLTTMLFVVNCSRPTSELDTDFDLLYAMRYSDEYKDSLAETLQPSYKRAMTLSNTERNREYMDSVLMELRWTRDSVLFLSLANKAQKYAKARNDDYRLAKVYSNTGVYYHDLEQLDSTYYYYLMAEHIYQKLNDSVRVGEMEFHESRLLLDMGLVMESESKVSKALFALRNHADSPIYSEANQIMAMCLIERGDYIEAERYFRQALELVRKQLNKGGDVNKDMLTKSLAAIYGNLATALHSQGRYEEANKYADLGLENVDEDSYPILISFLNTIKYTAVFELTKDVQVLEYIKESFKVDSSYNHTYRMFMTAMDLADLYSQIGNKQEAIYWGRKSYDLVKEEEGLESMEKEALEFLLLEEDYRLHSEVSRLIDLNRTLVKLDNNTRDKFARIAYETRVIEEENSHLKGVISKMGAIAISILSIIIVLFYIFRIRSKNKEIKLIQGQKQSNESIYQLIIEKNAITTKVKKAERNRIAKDLHDGVVNGIFTIRFNLQQLDCDNVGLKKILIEELQKLEGSTRDLSHSLRDVELFKESKFIHLIEDLIGLQRNAWNTEFLVVGKRNVNLEALSSSDKVNIYYIITEAIQNVNKHSQATKCVLSLSCNKGRIVFKITDNGIGISKTANEGIGLSNMKERANSLKSSLDISTPVGGGTSITFSVKVVDLENE